MVSPGNIAPQITDDMVASFQLDGQPVRGRICRLGAASIEPILSRHDYPEPVAIILGQAMTLAALVGASLKLEGRLLVQAEGSGPVSMLVGEFRSNGGIRGYARIDQLKWKALESRSESAAPAIAELFGRGSLALIIVQDDPKTVPYQGVVPLEKPTLAECAEDYFAQSEQLPSRVILSVGELIVPGEDSQWRGGGLLLQKIAGDETRGDTDDAWAEANALVATLHHAELADPDVEAATLLYRLFHERGVRLEPGLPIADECNCNIERLRAILSGMSAEDLGYMTEREEIVSADCQFCSRQYQIPLRDLKDD